jgi:hypothetical protein
MTYDIPSRSNSVVRLNEKTLSIIICIIFDLLGCEKFKGIIL